MRRLAWAQRLAPGRRLAWAAIVLIVIIAAGAGGAWLLQQRLGGSELRRTITAALERRTGRHVSLGDVSIHLLPTPRVAADDIVLGDPVMLSIGRARASIALWPLLRHVVRIDRLRLDHVSLHLARDATGRDNWSIRPQRPGAGSGSASGSGSHWRVELATAAIDDAAVSYHDARTGDGALLHLSSVDADALQADRPSLRVLGTSDGATYALRGTIGPLARLFAAPPPGAAAWPLSLRGSERVGGTVVGNASLSGTMADPAHLRGYDLMASVRLSNLAALNRLFTHAGLPSAQALEVSGRVRDAGHPSFSLLRASAGATAVPRLPNVDLRSWSLAAPSPGAPLKLALQASWQGEAMALTGTVTPRPDGGFSADGLRLVGPAGELDGTLSLAVPGWRPRLDTARADLSLRSARLAIGGRVYQDLRVQAGLRDGRLLVDPLQARGVLARLAADIGGSRPRYRLWLHPLIVPAASAERLLGHAPWLRGDVEITGQVDATGATRSSLLASASGHAGLSMVDGHVANAALGGVIGASLAGHRSAVAAVLPRGGELAVSCLALHGTLGGGSLMLDTANMQTTRISLDGGGKVGLVNGGLDLHLTTRALLGVASVSLPVHVGGVVSDPRPSLEAAAPGGRYSLDIEPDRAARAGCDAALQKAREGAAGPQPTSPKPGKAARGLDILRRLGLAH